MFERTTFLVIATSAASTVTTSELLARTNRAQSPTSAAPDNDANSAAASLDPTRYERTSELVKAFKLSCSRSSRQFAATVMQTPTFTAVLEELTKNTYVLVVVHDEEIGAPIIYAGTSLLTHIIETDAICMNIIAARSKFEQLQSVSVAA